MQKTNATFQTMTNDHVQTKTHFAFVPLFVSWEMKNMSKKMSKKCNAMTVFIEHTNVDH